SVSGQQRQSSSETTAGTDAADGDAIGVGAQRLGVVTQPQQSGITVLDIAGEAGLRGEPIVYGNYHAVVFPYQLSTKGCSHLGATDNIATAMDMEIGRPPHRTLRWCISEHAHPRRVGRTGGETLGNENICRWGRNLGGFHSQRPQLMEILLREWLIG